MALVTIIEPQSEPVPEMMPLAPTWRHCTEPVTPASLREPLTVMPPPTWSAPVVVAPPAIVSPPVCVPLPIVDDANAVSPALNCVRVEVALPAAWNGYAAATADARPAGLV